MVPTPSSQILLSSGQQVDTKKFIVKVCKVSGLGMKRTNLLLKQRYLRETEKEDGLWKRSQIYLGYLQSYHGQAMVALETI